MKKIFLFLIFSIFLSTNVNATFFENFQDVNGTDLNVHNTDWVTSSSSTEWFSKIIQNKGVSYVLNDGSGGGQTNLLINHDVNNLSEGEIFSYSLELDDIETIAGDSIVQFRVQNPLDNNIVSRINFERDSPGGDINNIFLIGTTPVFDRIAENNDKFIVIFEKKTQNFIYDISLYVNSSSVFSISDQNLNSDSFRFQQLTEGVGVGTGETKVTIDNFSFGETFENVSFSNFLDFNNISYTKKLDFEVDYSCGGSDKNVIIQVNDQNIETNILNCNNTINDFSGDYTHSNQGNFNIKFFLENISPSTKFSDQNFTSDLNAPVIDLNFTNASNAFAETTSQVSVFLTCNDTISPTIQYDVNNLTNDTNSLDITDDANLTKTADTNVLGGTNLFRGNCTDLVGNQSTKTQTTTIFSTCFNLVDEKDGTDWTGGEINNQFTNLTATSVSDGNTYDFVANSDNDICYTSVEDDTIRFDVNYASGLGLYREFNMGIVNDLNLGSEELDVCLATEQDFFEQLFFSSGNRIAILQNEISECYSIADFTKYAFQDTLSNRAFTIPGTYSLTTTLDGNLSILALINGAVESEINMDVLIFKENVFDLGLQPEELSVSLYKPISGQSDSNTVQIHYQNLQEDNISALVKIFDENTLLYSNTITSNPDAFTIYVDTTTFSINSEVLKITVTGTKQNGDESTVTKYFTLSGSSGSIGSAIAAILSFLLIIFGLTIVKWTQAFSWFGIIVVLTGIGILSFAPGLGYVVWLQAILIIATLFIFLTYKDETVRFN